MSSTPANSDPSDRMPFELGELLDGRFELQDVLGFGGYGLVYRAVQVTTGQMVAVKVLRRDKIHLQSKLELDRFKREMQIIAGICHTNIVRLIDFGELPDGTLFMVIEYIKGKPLLDVLRAEGGLRPREAFHLMRQILDALNAVHQQGIVYRDLKPANIMITQTGATRNAVLLDFGVSGISSSDLSELENLTTDGSVRGTPSYMAPEQLKQLPLTGQADIYAWGLVFLEALMGRKVISRASSVEVMAAQISDEPVPIPEEIAGSTCGSVIHRAIEKNLSQRWENAEEILAIMEHCYIDPLFSLPWTGAAGLKKIRETADVASSEYSRPTSSTTIQSLEISGDFLEPLDQHKNQTKNKTNLFWLVGVVVVVALALGAFWVMNRPQVAPSADTAVVLDVVEPAPAEKNGAKVETVEPTIKVADTLVEVAEQAPAALLPDPARLATPKPDVLANSNIEEEEPARGKPAPKRDKAMGKPSGKPEELEEPTVESVVEAPIEPVVPKKPPVSFEPVDGVSKDTWAPVGGSDIPDPWQK